MTGIPFLVQTAAYVQVAPPLALLWRRNVSEPVLWVVAAAVLSTLANIGARIAAVTMGNNLWLGYIDGALMYTAFLVALTYWQVSYVERLTLRVSIILFLLLYVALVTWVEDVTTFSLYSIPMYSMALLGASAWTLLRRALRPLAVPLHRTDWFWILGGLTIYGAVVGLAQPVSAVLLAGDRIDLLVLVYKVRAVFVDLAFVAITAGVLLPPARIGAAA